MSTQPVNSMGAVPGKTGAVNPTQTATKTENVDFSAKGEALSKVDEVKAKISDRTDLTAEQKVELNNLIDRALSEVGKPETYPDLPKPEKVTEDLSYKEVKKDFETKLKNWVTTYQSQQVDAEDDRAEANSAKGLERKLANAFVISSDDDKAYVASLIAEEMDKTPQGFMDKAEYINAIYDKVSKTLETVGFERKPGKPLGSG